MDWHQLFNPLVWAGLFVIGILCAGLAFLCLCVVAAFILMCRQLWCYAAESWREIGKVQ